MVILDYFIFFFFFLIAQKGVVLLSLALDFMVSNDTINDKRTWTGGNSHSRSMPPHVIGFI